ncbi:MFS transporter (plasmid) [Deinococcus sp. KNUC1210]|uniref:MFS transporter n=1 Tax=Deinococcus sp. KNUC1210 TaxID=2917691 RepID=UPI001EF0D3C5|nr:MFS transporter [Deinococcus sp. KNUC1210]ULH17041.1 MFS transporter [Deinococcus sp. KNUC1210]
MTERLHPSDRPVQPTAPLRLPGSLWVLALGNFAIGTSALMVAGVLGVLATDLHVSLGAAGATVTAYSLTYTLSAVLLGSLTAHLKRKPLLLLALVVFALGNLGAALAPTLPLLLLARIVSAIGASLFTPVASGVASALVPPEARGRALALVFVGIPIATVLGVPLGTWIGGALGWRSAFWLVVGLSVLAAAGVALLVRPVTTERPTAHWLDLLRRPALRRALMVMFLLYVGQFVVYPYLAPVLRTMTGLSASGLVLMLLWFGVAGLAGNALGGRLADSWNGPRTLQIGLSLLALSLLLLPLLASSVWGVAFLLGLWGVGGLMTNPPQQSRVVDLSPDAPSIGLALNASALYLGQAIGAPLGGLLAGTHLIWLGPVGGAVVIGALLTALSASPFRQPADTV